MRHNCELSFLSPTLQDLIFFAGYLFQAVPRRNNIFQVLSHSGCLWWDNNVTRTTNDGNRSHYDQEIKTGQCEQSNDKVDVKWNR